MIILYLFLAVIIGSLLLAAVQVAILLIFNATAEQDAKQDKTRPKFYHED